MNKSILLPLLLLFLACGCGSSSMVQQSAVNNSSSFSQTFQENHLEGTYRYDGRHDEVEIIRTKDTQIERGKDGSEIRMKIAWVSDQEYILEVESMRQFPDGCLKTGSRIRVKVEYADARGFTWSANESRCGQSTGRMLRVGP